jgi:hypothetical protein
MFGFGTLGELGFAAWTGLNPVSNKASQTILELETVMPNISSRCGAGVKNIATQPKLDGYTLPMACWVCASIPTPSTCLD